MFLSALNYIQREVAQVIVLHEEKAPTVKVRVDTEEREFRVDNVQGPWDVAARLREVFAFLQKNLKDTEVDLREVEYAACNGMLRTLDPHSVFLSPEAYREMNLSTSGHFGGLGHRDLDPRSDAHRHAPDAGHAGGPRGPQAPRSHHQDQQRVDAQHAARRRGAAPARQAGHEGHGLDPPRRQRRLAGLAAVRARRARRSRSSRSTPGRSVRASATCGSSSSRQQLATSSRPRSSELRKKEKLHGLVLDLRGNPGGLLEQAAKIADQFLDDGVIVSTVGGAEGREEKRATRRGTEPNYPIVVLVNGSSASASEIVAGALKNHDRAIIVGQTTFGKGTVQLVFPRITPEGAALKLTIAQYLTPGDVSIQGVGVAPDIELDPMTADTLEMDLFRSEHGAPRARPVEEPLERRQAQQRAAVLQAPLQLAGERAREIRERGGDLEDEFELDFPIKIARDLAGKLPPGQAHRPAARRQGAPRQGAGRRDRAVSADLQARHRLGGCRRRITKAGRRPSDFEVKVETDRKDDIGDRRRADDAQGVRQEQGQGAVYQLRAITKSDGRVLRREGARLRQDRPGRDQDGHRAARLLRRRGAQAWLDQAAAAGRQARLQDPDRRRSRARTSCSVRFFAEGGEPPQDAELRPTVQA